LNSVGLPGVAAPTADATETAAATDKAFTKIHSGKHCTGFKQTIQNTMKTPEDCYNWAKKADPTAEYFFFKPTEAKNTNYHCSPCPSSYEGGTAGTGSGYGNDIYQIN